MAPIHGGRRRNANKKKSKLQPRPNAEANTEPTSLFESKTEPKRQSESNTEPKIIFKPPTGAPSTNTETSKANQEARFVEQQTTLINQATKPISRQTTLSNRSFNRKSQYTSSNGGENTAQNVLQKTLTAQIVEQTITNETLGIRSFSLRFIDSETETAFGKLLNVPHRGNNTTFSWFLTVSIVVWVSWLSFSNVDLMGFLETWNDLNVPILVFLGGLVYMLLSMLSHMFGMFGNNSVTEAGVLIDEANEGFNIFQGQQEKQQQNEQEQSTSATSNRIASANTVLLGHDNMEEVEESGRLQTFQQTVVSVLRNGAKACGLGDIRDWEIGDRLTLCEPIRSCVCLLSLAFASTIILNDKNSNDKVKYINAMLAVSASMYIYLSSGWVWVRKLWLLAATALVTCLAVAITLHEQQNEQTGNDPKVTRFSEIDPESGTQFAIGAVILSVLVVAILLGLNARENERRERVSFVMAVTRTSAEVEVNKVNERLHQYYGEFTESGALRSGFWQNASILSGPLALVHEAHSKIHKLGNTTSLCQSGMTLGINALQLGQVCISGVATVSARSTRSSSQLLRKVDSYIDADSLMSTSLNAHQMLSSKDSYGSAQFASVVDLDTEDLLGIPPPPRKYSGTSDQACDVGTRFKGALRARSRSLIDLMDVPSSQERTLLMLMRDWRFGEGGLFARLRDKDLILPSAFHEHPLTTCALTALRNLNVFSDMKITENVCARFLVNIENRYMPRNKVFYHNSLHACDVLQGTFVLINARPHLFSPLAKLACVLAAASHDVGHPGTSNSFEIRNKSAAAIQYHNRSVLENFHASLAFKTMLKTPGNLMDELDPDQATSFHNLVVNIILETDLANHGDQVENLRGFDWSTLQHAPSITHTAQLSRAESMTSHSSFTAPDENDLEVLYCAVVHLADISCVSKPWDIYEQWIDLLFQEFYVQAEKERNMGLVNTLKRTETGPAQAQIGFIKFIVSPLFSVMHGYDDVLIPIMEHEISMNLIKLEEWVCCGSKQDVNRKSKVEEIICEEGRKIQEEEANDDDDDDDDEEEEVKCV